MQICLNSYYFPPAHLTMAMKICSCCFGEYTKIFPIPGTKHLMRALYLCFFFSHLSLPLSLSLSPFLPPTSLPATPHEILFPRFFTPCFLLTFQISI